MVVKYVYAWHVRDSIGIGFQISCGTLTDVGFPIYQPLSEFGLELPPLPEFQSGLAEQKRALTPGASCDAVESNSDLSVGSQRTLSIVVSKASSNCLAAISAACR